LFTDDELLGPTRFFERRAAFAKANGKGPKVKRIASPTSTSPRFARGPQEGRRWKFSEGFAVLHSEPAQLVEAAR
jgi:hypothetical protein